MIVSSLLAALALSASVADGAPCKAASEQHRAALEAAALRSVVEPGAGATWTEYRDGCAVVLFQIAEDGRVSDVRVAHATRPEVGESAARSVQLMRYEHGQAEAGALVVVFKASSQ
jgi:hypothetical protein